MDSFRSLSCLKFDMRTTTLKFAKIIATLIQDILALKESEVSETAFSPLAQKAEDIRIKKSQLIAFK